MASSHLALALDSLNAERRELDLAVQKINKRLSIVKAGIESLSALVAEETPSPDSATVVGGFDTTQPLRTQIQQVLAGSRSPLTARQIAEELLALGYETKSQDFANVVGTNLRSASDVFMKTDDGRWMVAEHL